MRRIIISILVVLVAPLLCRAELKVILKLDPLSAIRFESVNASVSVLNDSNEAFELDETNRYNKAHVIFMIEKKRDDYLKRGDDKPLVSSMNIAPGEKYDFAVDITTAYDLGAPGRYIVKAVVVTDKVRYESNPVVLDVVRGIHQASISKEVPDAPSRTRKYTLMYWSRNNNEVLFLSVDEDDGRTNYGVFPLGYVIRTFKPSLTVDRDGSVRVIHKATREYFLRSEFESDKEGILFLGQSRIDSEGKPYSPPPEKSGKPDDSEVKIPGK